MSSSPISFSPMLQYSQTTSNDSTLALTLDMSNYCNDESDLQWFWNQQMWIDYCVGYMAISNTKNNLKTHSSLVALFTSIIRLHNCSSCSSSSPFCRDLFALASSKQIPTLTQFTIHCVNHTYDKSELFRTNVIINSSNLSYDMFDDQLSFSSYTTRLHFSLHYGCCL